MRKIEEILKGAKDSLEKDGVDQWQRGYPNLDQVREDLERGEGFVFEEEGEVLAYAFLKAEREETYLPIEDSFKGQRPLTIHRFCVSQSKRKGGVGTRFFKEIMAYGRENSFDSLLIDTHRDNFRMRGLIGKFDFTYKCLIYVDDAGIQKERLCFERLL